MLEVTRIFTYPLKAARGVELLRTAFGELGLEHDRHFMIVNESGEAISSRSHPAISHIDLQDTGRGIEVSFPGRENLFVPFGASATSAPFNALIRSRANELELDRVEVIEVGERASAWFTEVLGKEGEKLRLVRKADGFQRKVEPGSSGERTAYTDLSDGYPCFVASEMDLACLSKELEGLCAPRDDMRRFRPNVVVDGEAPWELLGGSELVAPERDWSLPFVKPGARGKTPLVNPVTGELDLKEETLQGALRKLSRETIGVDDPCFGQNALSAKPGKRIAVGEKVELSPSDR